MTLAGYEPTPAEEMADVIEGEARELAPEQSVQQTTKRTNGGGSVSPLAQALVDAEVADNIPNAAKILNLLKPKASETPEQIIDLGKLYRAWRDSGATPDQAAKYAREGAQPK